MLFDHQGWTENPSSCLKRRMDFKVLSTSLTAYLSLIRVARQIRIFAIESQSSSNYTTILFTNEVFNDF